MKARTEASASQPAGSRYADRMRWITVFDTPEGRMTLLEILARIEVLVRSESKVPLVELREWIEGKLGFRDIDILPTMLENNLKLARASAVERIRE